jgi:branched-chain amino acid transport system substrate-binding protein
MTRKTIVLLSILAAACGPVSDGGLSSEERAESLLDSGDFAGAEQIYSKLIEEHPTDNSLSDWIAGRGRALLGMGRTEEALSAASDAGSAATDARQASTALLLEAMAEAAGGSHARAIAALGRLDKESLDGEEAEDADQLASGEVEALSSDDLQRARTSSWVEPFILLELSRRYQAEGDSDRAAMTSAELDRLYPGFRERHGGQEVPDTGGGSYIALLLPLTGDGSAYAAQVRNGVDLAFSRSADLIAGLPQLSTLDTRGSEAELARLAGNLARDGNCVAVIGPMTSREALEIADTAKAGELVFLSPTATSAQVDDIGGYVHRLVATGSDEAAAMAEHAVNTAGCERLAILHSYTAASVAQAEQFTATVEDLGAEVVATRAFSTDDTDFRSQILAIRGAGADGIFLPVTAYEAIQIAPQLRFYSVEIPIFGTSGWDNEIVPRMGGEYVEGAVFTTSFGSSSLYPPTARFVFHYSRAYSTDPSLLAAQAYDAATIILQAWSEGCRTRESMESRLNRMGSFSGAAGRSTIGASTELRTSIPMVTILEGEIIGIE